MPMTADQIDGFLEARRLAHFGTVSPDGRPRNRPVWYLWRDGAFWFTTRLEVRHTGADVAAGSPAAVSVASEERPYRAILAYGRPEVWEEDRDALLQAISFRYGEREGRSWLRGALTEPDRVVLRMVPDELVAWDYGSGDYRRMNAGASLRVHPGPDR